MSMNNYENINNGRQEVISIQCGQAGVQLGHALWELITIEHDISASGFINNQPDDISFTTFFCHSSNEHYFPRALIFDTEPTILDEIRCGYYRKLFHPDMLINNFQDASNNFARGYISEAKRMIYNLVDKTRYLIENCDNFSGFLVQSGTAGGTGSGLLSALMEHLLTEFAGRTNVQLSIFPGQKLSNCIVQPYNCILSAEKLIYCSDLNILIDNEMLYSICCNQLNIQRPSFSNINRVISPTLSGLTAPIRFHGMINSDLKGISTNLVPYPSLHFPLVSYAPLSCIDKLDHDLLNIESLTRSLFDQENQFIEVDLKQGSFLASALLYRGNCDLSSVLKTVQAIKKESDFKWVDWCPTGFKISHTVQRACSIPFNGSLNYDKTAMMISNHSSVASNLRILENKFSVLFRKKAYLHWYIGEGMEESEFLNAVYEVQIISSDYFNIVDRIFVNKTYSDKSQSSLKLENNIKEKDYNSDFLDIKILKLDSAIETSKIPIQSEEILQKNVVKYHSKLSFKENLTARKDISNSKETLTSKETKSSERLFYNKPSKTDTKDDEYGYDIDLDGPFKSSSVHDWSHLLTNRSTVDSEFDSNNAATAMYEMCEQNYVANSYKTLNNKKQILRQRHLSKSNSSRNFIQKIFRKNKELFNKLIHSQHYDFMTMCKL